MRHFVFPCSVATLSLGMVSSTSAGALIDASGPSQGVPTRLVRAAGATVLVSAVTTTTDHCQKSALVTSELTRIAIYVLADET